MHAGRIGSFLRVVSFLALAAASAAGSLEAAEPNTLTPEELADGWILLFDGQTTYGWRPAVKGNWKVVDGALVATEGEDGLLCTTSQFGNYQLKVDFRSAKGANSGVFLRTPPVPTDVAKRCYELNIADAGTNPFPTGSFVQRKKAEGESQNDSDDWQSFDVTADGGHFTVKLDGRTVLDYTDPAPVGRGFIGLQFKVGQIEFRNVKLKPLGTKSLFNGKDLTGWKTF
ncbi:MAG: 3-keto-disaccharide hydrolase, partial [Thermoguttaceae bacterium]